MTPPKPGDVYRDRNEELWVTSDDRELQRVGGHARYTLNELTTAFGPLTRLIPDPTPLGWVSHPDPASIKPGTEVMVGEVEGTWESPAPNNGMLVGYHNTPGFRDADRVWRGTPVYVRATPPPPEWLWGLLYNDGSTHWPNNGHDEQGCIDQLAENDHWLLLRRRADGDGPVEVLGVNGPASLPRVTPPDSSEDRR